jgi:hypothetical protein
VFVCQWWEGKQNALCRGVGGRCTENSWRESRRSCVEVLEDGVLVAVALKESQSEKRRRSN